MNQEYIKAIETWHLREYFMLFSLFIGLYLAVTVVFLNRWQSKAMKGLYLSEGRLLGAIVGLGMVARLMNLGGNSLWFDESITALTSKADFSHMLKSVVLADHPPLYFIIEWLWYRLWPFTIQPSEWWLRFPSVIFGTGNIPLMFLVARSFGLKKQERLMATFIMAFAPFQLWYSQEARMYQLLLSNILLAIYGYKTERWWLFQVGGIGSMYTQNLGGALGLVALGLVGLSERKFKPLAVSVMVIGGAVAPWLGYGLSQQISRVGQGFWIPDMTLGTIPYNFYVLIWAQLPEPLTLTLWPGGILTFFVVSLSFWHGRQHKSLLALATLPVIICTVISLLFVSVFVPRMLMAATPALYMLIAMTLTRSRLLIGTLMGVMLVMVMFNYYGFETKADSKQQANLINQYPGTIIYTANFLPLAWYLPERSARFLPVVRDDFTTRYNLNDEFFQALGVRHTTTQLTGITGQAVIVFALGVNTPQLYRDFFASFDVPMQRVPPHAEDNKSLWLKVITK